MSRLGWCPAHHRWLPAWQIMVDLVTGSLAHAAQVLLAYRGVMNREWGLR